MPPHMCIHRCGCICLYLLPVSCFVQWLIVLRPEPQRGPKRQGQQLRLTTREVFVAGAFAGACQTVVVLPTENIKTKLQVQVGSLSSSKLQYKGAIDCATQLARTQGLRSLLAGGTATVWREVPAYGIYFSVYEQVKALLKEKGAKEGVSAFAAGGIAGCSSWFAIAPLDVIKSRQQAMQDWRSKEASSLVACARGMYREGGHRIFFRGLGTIMVRAFPVNAVIFPIYEMTVGLLQPAKQK
eukprot:TRINITY_DN629_c0_g1_i6.p1 TRINITY_DN629_c0_g1~~TRINITY_DN629_c0_g1_i6.p1  ORF type:complete len:241 (-),score=11.20 TRINITY_DN629_c0_g1_i6:395-1117(-)